MNWFVRVCCVLALLGLPFAVAACDPAAASTAPAVQRVDDTTSSILATSGLGRPDLSDPPLTDPGTSGEPTDSVVATASAEASAAELPNAVPTITTRPDWAADLHGLINGIHTRKKVVALTFDDGPTAHTRKIVDELEAAGAHATFFWVGSRITTDAANYAVRHGEELANHTWSHPNMRKLSSEEASAQLGMTNARIAELTGTPPVWFRSPFNRLYPREYAQVVAHGMLYANYNVTSLDWMKGMRESDIVDTVDQNLTPGGVILLHDSPHHDPSYLPAVLRLLKRRGYDVVTMSTLAQTGDPVYEHLTLGVRGLGY